MLLHSDGSTTMDCVPRNCEPKEPFLPSVAFVRNFATRMRTVTNTPGTGMDHHDLNPNPLTGFWEL